METSTERSIVHVEDHRGCSPYNKQVFGQFLEHFHRQVHGGIFDPRSPRSDEDGFRIDVMDAVRDLRVPIVRWPGGCFVSAYHWLDGVGVDRKPAFDKAWHEADPNTFGTDEFIKWCSKVGTEPYICTNAGTGTPEEMSDWVEYCNGTSGKWAALRKENASETPYGVAYWSIGNENYGDWEIGAKTVDQWSHFVAESAKMMLHTDTTLKLSAAATSDIEWTLPLLKNAGKYLTYLSIHKYWDPLWLVNEPSSFIECMMASADPDRFIEHAESVIDAAGFKGKISIAFDEWNLKGWHHPPKNGVHGADVASRSGNDIASLYTMADALFSACFLNACLRHPDSVTMACMAPLVNARGPIFTHPEGIVKRTTYHVLWMYANLLEKNIARVHTRSPMIAFSGKSKMNIPDAVPAVDAIATCDDAMRQWRIALVNRHPSESVPCSLRLKALRWEGSVDATVLRGGSPDDYNDIDSPERVTPRKERLNVADGAILLPPHSLSVIDART